MKNLARYVIARWGYSTNLMSIELMDEADRLDALNALNTCNAVGWINPATQQSMLNASMISWHQTMKAYFDQIDPFNHLVTTAFADDQHPAHSSVYQHMDFSQAHSYYSLQTYNSNIEKELFDETQLYCNYSASYNKPFVHGETYAFFSNEAFGRQTDPHYYSMHAANWVSLMGGQFGTAKNWSALNFILSAPDAFNIYIGLGTFMAQQPLLSEQYIPNFRDDATRDIVFLQNKNKDRMVGYIQDKNFKFNKIMWANNQAYRPYLQNFDVASRPPLASATQTFSIPVVKNGEYDVTWYNSISGQQYSALVVATTSNQVTITVPSALLNGKFGDAVFTINYKCENHWNTGPLNDHASQSARPYTPVAFDPNSNKVFYVGQDNRIRATWFEGYFWNDGVLNPTAPTNVAAKTDLVTDGQGVVYFTATDSRIHRTYWNGTAWLEEALNIGAPANVSSYSALQVNAAGTKVFFIGNDKYIHQMVKSGGTWTESTLNPAAPANVMLRSDLVYDESASRIFFAGSNYRVHAMTLTNGVWVEGDLSTSAPQNVRTYNDIANSVKYAYSSMALDPTNGNIFFVALDNRVHEYVKNGATWNETALNSSAPANVRFSLGADYNYSMVADQQGKVFFFGTDNRIHQYYWNGTSWIEAANNILYDAQTAMSGLAASPEGEIYFAGSDWKMYSSHWGCNAKFRKLEPEENNAGEAIELPVAVSGPEQLKLYPNPASQELNIQLISGQTDEKMDVQLLDLSGRIVKQEASLPVQLAQFNIADLPAGVYIVRVTHSGVSQHARFVKQ